ncbi:MAG: HAD hydrolase-like protein [Bacteroidota bacterium]|nr:HAD hydrolase-like protein [Bacteroidota bacterium]
MVLIKIQIFVLLEDHQYISIKEVIKKYQNIFFDLDGTISDSYKGIENGILFALEKVGIKSISSQEIKTIIGTPLADSLKIHCSNDLKKTSEAVACFREYYSTKGIMECELYPGMQELLAWASNFYKLFVITAKPTIYANQLLEFQKVATFFTEIKGCELESNNFKKSNLMRSIPNSIESIIIGDKKQDIEAGKEIGIKTCGVLYGYGTEKEIKESNPDFIVNSISELKHLLHF